MEKYIIINLSDSACYGQFDSEERAKLKAKGLAEKNPGIAYAVSEIKYIAKYQYKEIELVEQDIE